MLVTLEYQVYERRRIEGRLRTVSTWHRAWLAEVLYADAKIVLTRSAGSHQTFDGVPTRAKLKKLASPRDYTIGPRLGAGIRANTWGHNPTHPSVRRLQLPHGRLDRVRISPASVLKLREALDARPHKFLSKGPK